MPSFKAVGPDGLHVGFYRKMWNIVGKTVCKFVLDFLNTRRLPDGVNDTFISIIPKVRNPEVVGQLRPISLCDLCYKLITKTLTYRLKTVTLDLVSPYQSSFVPRSQITDNIVIYQEMLYLMKNKKGVDGILALKIDLEKAYDRLLGFY